MAQGPPDTDVIGVSADVLAHVPGCERGEAPIAISPLGSASVNHSLRVGTRLGDFVVRFSRDRGTALALDRRREALLQGLAADAGLAPHLIWADPAGETLITEYAAGRIWTPEDMGDARELERLGERLRVVHALPRPQVSPFDAVATASRYRASIPESNAREAAQLDAWVGEIEALAPRIASETRAASIIHGDPHHANVIEGERVMLIDWEYATLADPLFDIGCVLAYYPAARRHSGRLLAAANLNADATLEMLSQACTLYERLSMLWARAVTAAPAYGARPAESAD